MSEQAEHHDEVDHDAFEARQHQGIRDWVSKQLGGEVQAIERLERWRPQWKVSFTKDGENDAVFVRGNRPIAGENDLRFEMEVMKVLEAKGILVPHIYGWMDSPKAFVMDWVDTDDRAPGMLHTAIENPTSMDDERWAAMLSYMDHLAKVHEVPVDEFTEIRGLRQLEGAEEIALRQTERMYRIGVATNNMDSALEFLQAWLRRNVPQHRTTASFIAGDAGQFMSHGSEVIALMDFEIAAIGDTHWDLACFRGRHPYENMGDIPALYRRYGETTGTPVDLPVVCYHTVNFLQLSSIAALTFMNPQARGANWIEGVLEYASITRRAFEAIAELQGFALDYDLRLPEPAHKRFEESGFEKMLVDIAQLPITSAFQEWERDLLASIPKFLLNHARYRDWFEAETVADIAQLTGEALENIDAADEALMQCIAKGDPDEDEALVRLFHRRLLRLSMIIAGTDPDDDNPLFHRLDPILE
jgi:aminoglycoside phosphotransferase (APT) family kinase protein